MRGARGTERGAEERVGSADVAASGVAATSLRRLCQTGAGTSCSLWIWSSQPRANPGEAGIDLQLLTKMNLKALKLFTLLLSIALTFLITPTSILLAKQNRCLGAFSQLLRHYVTKYIYNQNVVSVCQKQGLLSSMTFHLGG